MTTPITLEQLEKWTAQLSPQEQRELVDYLNACLGRPAPADPETAEQQRRREYAAQVEAFLKMSEENAVACRGPVDAAEDIRQIRDDRAAQL